MERIFNGEGSNLLLREAFSCTDLYPFADFSVRIRISFEGVLKDFFMPGKQFFIMQADGTYLDGDYAVFGTVLEGMEIVDQICKNTTVEDSNGTVRPENQPVIESIRIEEPKEP